MVPNDVEVDGKDESMMSAYLLRVRAALQDRSKHPLVLVAPFLVARQRLPRHHQRGLTPEFGHDIGSQAQISIHMTQKIGPQQSTSHDKCRVVMRQ